MAKVNRYTNIQAAQYNPMSLQELMMVPALKRQQHDTLLENVANTRTALAQADYMDIHGDKVSKVKQQLEEELERQVNEVAGKGISQTLKSDFINLHSKYQGEVGPKGTIGKAMAAKQSVEQNRADLLANAVKIGHDPVRTAEKFDEALRAYEAAQAQSKDISNMDAVYAPNKEDLEEDLLKVRQMLGTTVKTENGEEKFTIQKEPTTGGYVMVTETGKVIKENNNAQLAQANNYLKTKWLSETGEGFRSADWNGQSREDIESLINSGLGIMQVDKTNDQSGKKFQYIAAAKKAEDDRDAGQIPSYINAPTETHKVFRAGLSDNLGKILEGATHNNLTMPVDPKDSSKMQQMVREQNKRAGKPFNFEQDLNQAEQAEYNDVSKGLRERGLIPNNIVPKSAEEMTYVKNYVDDHLNVTHNNQLITSDTMTTFGQSSIGVEKSSPEKIAESVYLTAHLRSYHDPKTGEFMDYDKLPDEVKANLSKAKAVGHYSPKNVWGETVSKDSHRKMLVAPIELKVPTSEGDVSILVSRQDSEYNTPSFQAADEFNKIYAKTNMKPGIPHTFNLKGTDVNVMRITDRDPDYKKAVTETLNSVYTSLLEQYPNESVEALKNRAIRLVGNSPLYITNAADNSDPVYVTEDMLYGTIKNMNGLKKENE